MPTRTQRRPRPARTPASPPSSFKRHGVDARFLYFYFPDENHWIEKPQNIRLWYQTVLAFLDHHVLGQEWARPALI